MAASKDTIHQVAKILITELGLDKACWIARRLVEETEGNSSYTATVQGLLRELQAVRGK